jgi:hypothetical protein
MQLGPFYMSTRTRRRSRRGSPFQGKMSEIIGRAVGLMLITGCLITGCGTGTPTDSTSPATTAATTRTASPVGSGTATTAATTRTASAVGSATGGVANTQPPLRKTQPTKTRTAVTPSKAPVPPTPARTTPAAAPTPPASTAGPSCYPLTNGGKCYEPGEYCRNSDHGMSGVAGDGEAIVCKDNDGWRWEPA